LQDGEAADVSLRARERLVAIQQANALLVNISGDAEWHTVVLAHPPLSIAIVTGACGPRIIITANGRCDKQHPSLSPLCLAFVFCHSNHFVS
jgi:hypothetical protein